MYQEEIGNEDVITGNEQGEEKNLEALWDKDYVLKGLTEEARTPQFDKAYQQLRRKHPPLGHYTTPELFIGMLHGKSGDYDEKDRVLHAVISAIQNEPELQQCGLILLSLAMWPALEHTHYNLIHLSPCVPDLFAAIHGYFLDEILDFKLAKTTKIAINLQLNVKKRVLQAIAKEAQYQAHALAYIAVDEEIDQVLEDPRKNRFFQLKGFLDLIPEKAVKSCLRNASKAQPRVLSEPDRVIFGEALRNFVEQGILSADDSRLISDHLLHGVELKEIARRRGVKENALRIRYFRIKKRLRPYM